MIKVVLFGNTGLANGVFRALIQNDSIELCGVFTRKLPGEFPYYPETELWDLSEKNNIITFTDQNVNSDEAKEFLTKVKPDYIVVSSFDQIIKKKTIELARLGIINYHPSILPKYRGPNPISWVLINGEEETGLTIHRLIKDIDAGKILYQEKLSVNSSDNLGSLYFKLSGLAETMSKKMVEDIVEHGLPAGEVQNENEKSYYAKSLVFKYIDLEDSLKNIINRVRAFLPFPNPIIKFNNEEYLIKDLKVDYNTTDNYNQPIITNGKLYYTKENCTLEFDIQSLKAN